MQNTQDIKTSKVAIPDDQDLLKELQALKVNISTTEESYWCLLYIDWSFPTLLIRKLMHFQFF